MGKNMKKINMVGGPFQHDVCSSALNKNKYVEWVRDGSADTSIYIDGALLSVTPSKETKNYGWLMESSSIIPREISWVLNNIDFYKDNFECIFTHDKTILEKSDIFKYTLPNALPWVRNREIYKKTKNTSVIVSSKSGTSGYTFRLGQLKKIMSSGSVDQYGRGFNTLPWVYEYGGLEETGKLMGLKDYRFSFAFENANYLGAFCEKLTDCFATGTIPIFWGSPDIGDYFDLDGIIVYNENMDINSLTEDLYLSKMDAIKNNFHLVNELLSSEDYIYINYLK